MTKVFVSGCYDIIHGGHVEFFRQAKSLGDWLTVCIASDEVLWAHKHRDPILPLLHRVEVVAAFSMVDEVLVGDDRDMGLNFETHFRRIKPNILAVTTDDEYGDIKRKLCAEVGARYVQMPKRLSFEKVSSTELRDKASAILPIGV